MEQEQPDNLEAFADCISESAAADRISITCGCGHVQDFGSFDSMQRLWKGELFRINTSVFMMCPKCADIRHVNTSLTESNESTIETEIKLGEVVLSAKEAATLPMHEFEDRLEQAAGLDTDYITDCPTCLNPIYPDDRKTGPDAPEIGWTYYECDDCHDHFAPQTIEGRNR